MSYFVYILQTQKDNTYYKGFTENPLHRLAQHNNGESKYRKVFFILFKTK
jgi:putative endonuclease